ncbi:MAG: DUF1501 domain-containing protein [Verrucomicrobiales bacterium]|nr:DUF1501 domain-containing protein [Verrucomicrobiales bacterium]MBP9222594.1 DUF1501 domain-containing protein [Verrucomicrobiales bacterium]
MNSTRKSDEWSRRRFMEGTAKTFLGVGALGLTTRAAGALGPDLGIASRAGAAKHIIYLYMNGGMSHLDTFDTKPNHENHGETKTINSNVDDLKISSYLPSLAKQAEKLTIVRSMTSTAGAHDQGNYLMHTSYDQGATIRHPGIGAWSLKYKGRINPNLPGSVFIGGDSRINGGAGFFEPEFEPLTISDPEAGLKNSKIRGMKEETFQHRLSLANEFDVEFHKRYQVKEVRAYTQMYDDAVRIMQSRDLAAFDLSSEDKLTRERYGVNSFGQGCLLARRLVEHDVRAIEVSLGGWDMHNGVFVSAPEKCAILDQAMSALLTDLERRGKLEDTLIVLTTEFGRTPRINQNAGRDHYPKAFSSVLAGGGLKGGIAYGQTDEAGENVVENPVKIADFNATIAYALGLPLDQVLYSPSKRPFTVAHKGKPVLDLFA